MARKPRVHYEGALYHVISRGNNKEYIFSNDEDKNIYLETILRYKEKYDFKLYAYCIMDNHAHMLIEVGEVPLSKIMQCIQQVFTMKYNKKYNRTGHVFEQRYKAILCNKDEYLLNLVRYIHQNPVRSGIKEKLNYAWSSHNIYIVMNESKLVDYKYVLSILSEDTNRAIKEYADLVKEKINIEEIKDKGLDQEIKQVKEHKQKGTKKFDHSYLMQKVCEHYNIEPNELCNKKRKQKIVNARKTYILLSKTYSDISNKDLAQELNLAEPTVSNILSDENNKKLIEIIKL